MSDESAAGISVKTGERRTRQRAFALAVVIGWCGVAVEHASAQAVRTEDQKLVASDGERGSFGRQVSLANDRLIVGHENDDNDGGDDAGSAYVFERDDESGAWQEVAKLTASDAAMFDGFGNAVSLSGDRAFIGADSDDNDSGVNAGAVYVFERDSTGAWTEVTKLTASDSVAFSGFGRSVSLVGNRALISNLGEPNSPDGSSVYVFERDAATGIWSETTKLMASDRRSRDSFGTSVALAVDRAVVGASRDDNEGGTDAGAAYVFERDNTGAWSQSTELTASDGAEIQLFGTSVSLSGEQALIGAVDFGGDFGRNNGAAYVFERDDTGAWTEVAKLTGSDVSSDNATFGGRVAINGDRAIVGATGRQGNTGAAYVFERNIDTGNWAEVSKYIASDGVGTAFGQSVALTDERAIVGVEAGALYVFEFAFSDSDGDGVSDETDNCPMIENPQQEDIDGDQIGDACDPVDDRDVSCGAPDISAGEDRGLYFYVACNATPGEEVINVVGTGGGKWARYRGMISSRGPLSTPQPVGLETGDQATLAPSGQRIDFSMTMSGIWSDGFSFSASTATCVDVRERSDGAGVFVGPSKRAVSGSFDPSTGAACTPPDTGDRCGPPSISATMASGLYVWQECDATWNVFFTGIGSNGEVVRTSGSIDSFLSPFTGLQNLSVESSDVAFLDTGTSAVFDLTTIQPWNDAFTFTTNGDGEVCFRLDGLSSGLSVRLGADARPISISSFNAISGESCSGF